MKRLLTVLLILAFIPAATVLAGDRDPVVIIKTSMGEISDNYQFSIPYGGLILVLSVTLFHSGLLRGKG